MGPNLTPSLESSILSGRVIVRIDTNILKRALERIVAQQKMDIFHFVFQGCLTKPLLPHSPPHLIAIGFWVCMFHSYCENYQQHSSLRQERHIITVLTPEATVWGQQSLRLYLGLSVFLSISYKDTHQTEHPPHCKGTPTSILAFVVSSNTQLPNNVTQINPKHRPSIQDCRYIPHFRVNQT